MLCKRCESVQVGQGGAPQRVAPPPRLPTCDECGATILTLGGVSVGVGDATLARLARFGLAVTEEPLLELKRGGT